MSVYSHHDKELMGQILKNQILIMEYLAADSVNNSSLTVKRIAGFIEGFKETVEETKQLLK